MVLDRVTIVNRVAKAIDKVFTSDGWIGDQKVFLAEDLNRIGEAIGRRAADPERYVCQGFHTTSVIQSKMRQLLETNPVEVIEPIAEVVTTGKTTIGVDSKVEIEVDLESLALDLEARLCDESTIPTKGYRDACGQIFDLIVMQAFLNQKISEEISYSFYVRPSEKCLTTGETIVKRFKSIPGRQDLVHEGAALTIENAIQISYLLEGRADGCLFHHSLFATPFELPVFSAENLVERARFYFKQTRRPVQIAVYINRLLGLNLAPTGHDLHMISAIYDELSQSFYCQSHWGQSYDSRLSGISKEFLFSSMEFKPRDGGIKEEYDNSSPQDRFIDSVFPVKPRDWSQPLLEMKKEAMKLDELERDAFKTPQGQALRKYREDLKQWEEMKAQHVKVFGDSIEFDKPKPKRP